MGESASLGAAFVWACASLLFASLGRQRTSPLTMNLLKCTLALGLMALTLWATTGRGWPVSLSGASLAALGVSALLGIALGDTAYFHALTRLGPRRTLTFSTLGPALTALIAWPVLGERWTWAMAAGMVLTLLGVSTVSRERAAGATSEQGLDWVGIGWAVLGVACQAIGTVLTKLGGQELLPLEISVVRLSVGVCALAFYVTATGKLSAAAAPLKQPALLKTLIAGTFLGTYLGIWLSMTGVRYTYAGIAATLTSTSPIFVLPLAAIFLKERISARAALGAALAVAGVAILSMSRAAG
jgi:drug/metabolite transporter (DMT)-like permease